MRQDDETSPLDRRKNWESVLLGRLVMRFAAESPGANTDNSENSLGMPPCSYFYVGYICPDIARRVVAYTAVTSDPASGADRSFPFAVSPFDTGAFATGRLPFRTGSEPSDGDERKEFLHRYSFGTDYSSKMEDWLDRSYAEEPASHYADGEEPSEHYCDSIDLSSRETGVDARCWTWEARIPKTGAGDAEMTRLALKHVWMKKDDQLKLSSYLRGDSTIPAKDRIELMRKIYDDDIVKATDSGDPYTEALQWLKGRE